MSRSGLKDLGLGAVEAGGGDLGDGRLEVVEGVVDEALGDVGPGLDAVEEAEQQGRREKTKEVFISEQGRAGENAAGRGTLAPGREWRVVGCIKLSKY